MSKLARVLIAGTSAATLISAASFAEPINDVEVDQSQDGDAQADDTIEAGYTRAAVSVATAQGNSSTGSLSGESALTGTQTLNGSVGANSIVSATEIWATASSTATAQGNALTVGVEGDLDMGLSQTAGTGSVSALSALRLSSYGAHTVQSATSAVNAVQTSAYGSQSLRLSQASASDSVSTARLEAADAEVETATLIAVAAGNSAISVGEGDTLDLSVDQNQSGNTLARADMEVGLADYGAIASSQAAGNTVTLQNDFGSGSVSGVQTNTGSVRAETVVLADSFDNGFLTATANAMGNSALASTIGADTYSGVNQTNTGAVTASVLVEGGYAGGAGQGQGSLASASAIGNAQSAYVCAECPVGLNAQITQTNSGTVTASALTRQPGVTGSLSSSATAVGNASTFSTRSRGGN